MSTKANHSNAIPFAGTLTKLDTPSDKFVGGSRMHRVTLSYRAAVEALPTLEGMGIGFANNYDMHNKRQKCGVITKAWIEGDDVKVSGHLYGDDFPEVIEALKMYGDRMGMSYEMREPKIENTSAMIWVVVKARFTGAAIILRDKAAFECTIISLEAAAEESPRDLQIVGTIELDQERP